MSRLSCPVDRTLLAEGATHCPRCGLRVAALPRRRGGDVAATERPPVTTTEALRRGLLVGTGLTALLVLAGVVTRLAGGSGSTVTGDGCLVVAGASVLGAAFSGGVRFTRWSDFEPLKERARSGGQLGPTRVTLLSAALVPAIVVVILAVTH